MDFFKMEKYLDGLSEVYGIPFSEISVCKGYEKVFRYTAGELPNGNNTLYRLFSMTKLFTVTATMQLVESGKLGLDDPVYKYLPEYKYLMVEKNGVAHVAERTMTIRHLLSMRSGLSYSKTKPNLAKALSDNEVTTREVAYALAKDTLDFEPGTSWFYSWSHDVLGAVIEVVSGMRLSEYMQKEIFVPLGISDMTFHPTEEQLERIAPSYTFLCKTYSVEPQEDHMRNVPTKNFEGGGGGLCGSNDEYAKLPMALANGGMAENGRRILKPETIELIKVNQMPAEEQFKFARMKPGYGYGLGVRTLVDRSDAETQAPFGEFGWDGAAASYAMVDTENKISVTWTTHVHNCRPAYREIHPHIRNLVYAALGIK